MKMLFIDDLDDINFAFRSHVLSRLRVRECQAAIGKMVSGTKRPRKSRTPRVGASRIM